MSQSLSKIYVHGVFSTKNREPRLLDAWREESFQVLGGTANKIGCQSLIVGGVADHVHVLFQLGRTISVADAFKSIKVAASAWINDVCRPESEFHWQAGYAAFSVSQSNVEAVSNYIATQPAHHKTHSFQDELREWLGKYEIEWDEEFLWD